MWPCSAGSIIGRGAVSADVDSPAVGSDRGASTGGRRGRTVQNATPGRCAGRGGTAEGIAGVGGQGVRAAWPARVVTRVRPESPGQISVPAQQGRGETIKRRSRWWPPGRSRASADKIARSAQDNLGVLTWRWSTATWGVGGGSRHLWPGRSGRAGQASQARAARYLTPWPIAQQRRRGQRAVTPFSASTGSLFVIAGSCAPKCGRGIGVYGKPFCLLRNAD